MSSRTLFAACLSRLGLTQSEAADLLSARVDTIKNWSVGRIRVPDGVWDELRAYEDQIADRSDVIREIWEDNDRPDEIEAVWDPEDGRSLQALADFVLSAAVTPRIP